VIVFDRHLVDIIWAEIEIICEDIIMHENREILDWLKI
jgi:hypothetical protein